MDTAYITEQIDHIISKGWEPRAVNGSALPDAYGAITSQAQEMLEKLSPHPVRLFTIDRAAFCPPHAITVKGRKIRMEGDFNASLMQQYIIRRGADLLGTSIKKAPESLARAAKSFSENSASTNNALAYRPIPFNDNNHLTTLFILLTPASPSQGTNFGDAILCRRGFMFLRGGETEEFYAPRVFWHEIGHHVCASMVMQGYLDSIFLTTAGQEPVGPYLNHLSELYAEVFASLMMLRNNPGNTTLRQIENWAAKRHIQAGVGVAVQYQHLPAVRLIQDRFQNDFSKLADMSPKELAQLTADISLKASLTQSQITALRSLKDFHPWESSEKLNMSKPDWLPHFMQQDWEWAYRRLLVSAPDGEGISLDAQRQLIVKLAMSSLQAQAPLFRPSFTCHFLMNQCTQRLANMRLGLGQGAHQLFDRAYKEIIKGSPRLVGLEERLDIYTAIKSAVEERTGNTSSASRHISTPRPPTEPRAR